MEVIDGKLIEIPSTTPCLLLAHVPNKKWSYDVNILEKLDAEDGIKHLNPLPQKTDQPKEFYAVVMETDYEEYMKDYAFRELPSRTKEPKKDVIIQSKPVPKIVDIWDENVKLSDLPNYPTSFDYSPTLYRSSEKPVYKFKSGSQKYG